VSARVPLCSASSSGLDAFRDLALAEFSRCLRCRLGVVFFEPAWDRCFALIHCEDGSPCHDVLACSECCQTECADVILIDLIRNGSNSNLVPKIINR
jgi:hypothetical protein